MTSSGGKYEQWLLEYPQRFTRFFAYDFYVVYTVNR
jgi:hypothetical protein